MTSATGQYRYCVIILVVPQQTYINLVIGLLVIYMTKRNM